MTGINEAPYAGTPVELPTIDLANASTSAGRSSIARSLAHAMQTTAMAQLVGHGIPPALLSAAADRAREFFALPLARKNDFSALRRPWADGSDGGRPASINGRRPTEGDLPYGGSYPQGRAYSVPTSWTDVDGATHVITEWLQVRDASKPYVQDDEYFSCLEGRVFFAPATPQTTVLPTEVPGLKAATWGCYRAIEELTERVLLGVLGLAVGEDEGFFISKCRKSTNWPVTIAHYPPQLKPPPDAGTVRIAGHWDSTLFALVVPMGGGDPSDPGLQLLCDSSGMGKNS